MTHLVIKRPPHFYFRPGDYVFVNIPAIAKYEWHPFTLSSAPEQEDYMWLHIRGVGEWTNRLYSYFEKEQARLHSGEVMPSIAASGEKKPEIAAIKPISSTPQRDFLAKNLLQMRQSPMMPAKTHDPPKPTSSNPATLTNENEIEKKENPFKFDVATVANSSDSAVPKTMSETKAPGQGMKMERQLSETSSAIRKIQATLQRTFSRKGTQSQDGFSNDGFVGDDLNADTENKLPMRRRLGAERRGTDLGFKNKTPLEKSLSMPDIENRMRKRDRLMALREYNRSESERSFDETQMKKARMKSLGLAYLSPQNRSLAQSFRYMRNKPTIIAFKTPSLENCEQRPSQNSMGKYCYVLQIEIIIIFMASRLYFNAQTFYH